MGKRTALYTVEMSFRTTSTGHGVANATAVNLFFFLAFRMTFRYRDMAQQHLRRRLYAGWARTVATRCEAAFLPCIDSTKDLTVHKPASPGGRRAEVHAVDTEESRQHAAALPLLKLTISGIFRFLAWRDLQIYNLARCECILIRSFTVWPVPFTLFLTTNLQTSSSHALT